MGSAYLLSLLLVITAVNAERSLLVSGADPYGIIAAAQSGNASAAILGFSEAGDAADATSTAAALAKIFNTVIGPPGQNELYVTAEALSEAALSVPANYETLSSAYVQATLEQLTINTPASIQVATAALAALRSAQQPLMVQTVFEQAFAMGLASQAALVTGTIEREGPCSNSTFLAAQYSLALGYTMTVNQTAAGLALAAALDADLAGCAVAAASGLPLLEAGCSQSTLRVLATAQEAMTSRTGDNTALATSIATYAPSSKTLTCLATAIIDNSGQDATAQQAAVVSYQTTVAQTVIAAGRNASKVAGAGESFYESVELGPSTASGMASLSGLAALAQMTSCNYIYPVLIQSQAWMTLELFEKSVNQSAALSACYALGMKAGANAAPSPEAT
ncbi:hypothetical protein ABBQ38_012492 [Trebouxia sp. C0009 RCD-2024]